MSIFDPVGNAWGQQNNNLINEYERQKQVQALRGMYQGMQNAIPAEPPPPREPNKLLLLLE